MSKQTTTTAANVRHYENETLTALDLAIIAQMGGEARNTESGCEIDADTCADLENVTQCSSGAAGGFRGFIYYSETVDFTMKNRAAIIEKLREDVESGLFDGCNGIISAVLMFNCLKTEDKQERAELEEEAAICLFGDPEEYRRRDFAQVANALAWAALEDLAFRFCDWEESAED